MFRRGLKLLALTVIAGFPCAAAYADPIVVTSLTPLTLTLNSSTTTTTGTQTTPWLLNETFIAAGAGVLSFADTDNDPLAANGVPTHTSGSWFTKTVTNNSGIAWTSFEMELQQILGTPSGEGDGLSFAQGAGLSFTSNVFPTLTQIFTTRDYLNFSGGTVANGGSVTFSFAVTDNSPQTPFYLNQTPNKVDAPVPEPATLALLGTGLAGWMYRRRRHA